MRADLLRLSGGGISSSLDDTWLLMAAHSTQQSFCSFKPQGYAVQANLFTLHEQIATLAAYGTHAVAGHYPVSVHRTP